MNQNAIVEQVLTAALEKMGQDVGELLGQTLTCSEAHFSLVTKHDYFLDQPRDKSTLVHLAASGDRDGRACMLLPVSAAIHLGGTLIMLPAETIAEKVTAETLKGEEADAFAEIANILTGSLSQTLQARYPKKLHLAKDEIEELVPTTVDPEGDTPFPPGHYLICTSDLDLDGTALGPLDLIFPLELFDLEPPVADAGATPPAPEPPAAAAAEDKTGAPAEAAAAPAPAPAEEAAPAPAAAAELTPEQVKRNRSIIDLILKTAVQKVDSELGALLGEFVATADIKLQFCTKDGYFFDNPRGTLVMSRLSVSGDREGEAFIAIEMRDATFLGGTLIMLPADEIQQQIDSEQFEGEAADAYGEIANILAGVISNAFENKHPKKFHFVRKESFTVVPTMVDAAGAEPFPPGEYYHCSCSLTVGEKELGLLDLLFPGELLEIRSGVVEAPQVGRAAPAGVDKVAPTAGAPAAAAGTASATEQVATAAPEAGGVEAVSAHSEPREEVLLVVSNDAEEGTRFQQALEPVGPRCLLLGFQDDLKAAFREYRPGLVFLVMRQVDEQGFSVAIKLQSAAVPPPPLVVGGPQWTRSSVLRALKYGAQDILITPADTAEIVEKASVLLRRNAAG